MSIMEWDSSLDIGVEEMNDQHKVLLDIMNRMHDEYEKDESSSMLGMLLNQLETATVKHFSEEEQFMEQHNYPGLGMHKNVHKSLLSKFADHKKTFEQTGVMDDAFFAFLKLWLTAHIQGIDAKYAAHVNGSAA